MYVVANNISHLHSDATPTVIYILNWTYFEVGMQLQFMHKGISIIFYLNMNCKNIFGEVGTGEALHLSQTDFQLFHCFLDQKIQCTNGTTKLLSKFDQN